MSTARKRHQVDFSFSSLPEIPKLSADVALEVFTHQSLTRAHPQRHDCYYGTNERLSKLGAPLLELATIDTLQRKSTLLSGSELEAQSAELLSDSNMVLFCQVYHLIDRVRCLPDIVPSIALPEESRKLFCAYIGAIYVDSGLDKIYSWIRQLFSEGVYSPMTVSNRLLAEDELCLPAKKRMRLNTTSNTTTSGISIPSLATHPSTSSLTSPKTQRFLNISFDSNNQSKASLPSESRASANAGLTSSLSDPLFPPMQPLEQVDNPPPWVRHRDAVKSGQCLPVFNQLASQKCLSVEWHPAFEGSPHNGTWIMQCVVQGIPRGYGKGPNKSAAKEDAVRQAWIALWGDH